MAVLRLLICQAPDIQACIHIVITEFVILKKNQKPNCKCPTSVTCNREEASLGRVGALVLGAGPGNEAAGEGPLTPGGPGSRGPYDPSKLLSLVPPRGPPRNWGRS